MIFDRERPARVSRALAERVSLRLSRELGDSKVLVGAEVVASYASDDSRVACDPPDVVVLAESESDIAAVLAVAHEERVPVTPRGGGSGRVGGAVPVAGGIVLATTGLGSIRAIDREDGVARVEPGVVLADLHEAVERENLFYAPDPNSRTMCFLGGNAATNAAGPRAFKYGATRDHVLGARVVLPGGSVLNVGRSTRKGVSGYDFTSLFVGSEGTLGVFSELTLKLLPKPTEVATLLAMFESEGAACEASVSMCALRPRLVEFVDARACASMRAGGLSVIAEHCGGLLLVEFDEDVERQIERAGNELARFGADVRAATTTAQRAEIWSVRANLSYAVRALARYKISEDVVVPRSRLRDLLAGVRAIANEEGVLHLVYGHAGDGNMHVNWFWDDPSEEEKVERAVARMFELAIEVGGTLSGEHGLGLLKASFFDLEHNAIARAKHEETKALFDPRGI